LTTTILQGFVALFGVIIVGICAYGALVPEKFSGSMKTTVQQSWAIVAAAGTRILFGILLITIADVTRAPSIFHALGFFVILTGILIPVLGRVRIDSLMNWFLDKGPGFVRVWMVFGVAFGLLIVHGTGIY
jgi:hypothetical protein